jgi:iron complex outermembrane receptor protein
LLVGTSYFHTYYSSQEIDIGLANGDTIAASGSSIYHGVNMYADEDPIANLHFFVNGNVEGAKYASYTVGCSGVGTSDCISYAGSPVSYVPETLFNFGAYYEFKFHSLQIQPMAAFQYVGTQHLFDNSFGAPSQQTVDAYGTLNFSVNVPYRFMKFQFAALNVLNKNYNEYEYISSGSYFGTSGFYTGTLSPPPPPYAGYVLAYPAAPFTAYGSVKFRY